RAAPALAALLPDAARRSTAEDGLRDIGAAAGKDVKPYAFHADANVRDTALRLLSGYGVREGDLTDLALTELKSPSDERRAGAAGFLAGLPADARKQAEVARALDPLLKDNSLPVKVAALKALKVWATQENVPSLAALLAEQHGGGPTVLLLIEILSR